MRTIVGIIFAALLGWCIWWFVGAKAQETAWESWFEERRRAGWVAEMSEIKVRGFPNRLDTTVSEVQLADPVSGWAWSMPFFQVLMLSYKPNHILAVWPDTQKISAPGETLLVSSVKMRGSVVFVPNTDLTLDRTQIEIASLGLLGTGWNAALGQANFATRRVGEGDAPDFAHQLGLDAQDLRFSEGLKNRLDPAGVLPAAVEKLHIDLIAAFDAPWDRHSVEGRKPQLTALSVRDIDLRWGELNLTANGKVSVDQQGYPVGDISVKAVNWQDIIDLTVSSGLVGRDLATTIKDGLGFLAMLGGDPNTLNVPLKFADGYVLLGPIPIGPAPRLAIR